MSIFLLPVHLWLIPVSLCLWANIYICIKYIEVIHGSCCSLCEHENIFETSKLVKGTIVIDFFYRCLIFFSNKVLFHSVACWLFKTRGTLWGVPVDSGDPAAPPLLYPGAWNKKVSKNTFGRFFCISLCSLGSHSPQLNLFKQTKIQAPSALKSDLHLCWGAMAPHERRWFRSKVDTFNACFTVSVFEPL